MQNYKLYITSVINLKNYLSKKSEGLFMARYTDPFGDMDDIFNQLWGNNGLSSESSRYMINGRV